MIGPFCSQCLRLLTQALRPVQPCVLGDSQVGRKYRTTTHAISQRILFVPAVRDDCPNTGTILFHSWPVPDGRSSQLGHQVSVTLWYETCTCCMELTPLCVATDPVWRPSSLLKLDAVRLDLSQTSRRSESGELSRNSAVNAAHVVAPLLSFILQPRCFQERLHPCFGASHRQMGQALRCSAAAACLRLQHGAGQRGARAHQPVLCSRGL